MNAQLVRTNAILPFPNYADADFSGKEGYPAYIHGSTVSIRLCQGTTDWPAGVIVKGGSAGEKSSFALCYGLAGTVRVKLGANVDEPGTVLQVVQSGTDYLAGPDTGSGARVTFAFALEAGTAGELIEAALFPTLALT